jgi:hypothetical protein
MIVEFASRKTEKVWRGEVSRKPPRDIQQIALRKLCMLDKAQPLNVWRDRLAPSTRPTHWTADNSVSPKKRAQYWVRTSFKLMEEPMSIYKVFYTDRQLPAGAKLPDLSLTMPLEFVSRDEALNKAFKLIYSGAVVWKIEGPAGFILDRAEIEKRYGVFQKTWFTSLLSLAKYWKRGWNGTRFQG